MRKSPTLSANTCFMALPEFYAPFIRPLNALGLDYFVTGSVASGIYGEIRTTLDIDIVLELSVADALRLGNAFPIESYYCPPRDVILIESRRPGRGQFNLIHHQSGFKADVFVQGRNPLNHWAMANRAQHDYGDGDWMWVAPPEYVILKKLEYYREGGSEKHPRDIRFMLACTDVDRTFIEQHIARLGLGEQWAECQ